MWDLNKTNNRNRWLVHKAQVWAAQIIHLNYFETSFTPAFSSMVTRSGVTFLLVTLLSVSDGRRNFEETSKQCPKNFECVHRSVCEQYNQRYAEYERTNNAQIRTELKALICNKRKRAVCCRQLSSSICGKPQKIPESVNNSYTDRISLCKHKHLLDHQWHKNSTWWVPFLWTHRLPKGEIHNPST